MLKKTIYKITVTNWDKHNSSKKKGHRSILLSVGFLNDAKVRQLTPTGKLLFLSCLLLSGESSQSQFEVTHESLRSHSGVKSESLQSQLDQLQSLQLVSYTILAPLIIEKNRIEKNRREVPKIQKPSAVPTVVEPLLTDRSCERDVGKETQGVVAAYCKAFKDRYKSNPHLDPKVLKQIKTAIMKTREGELAEMVQVYVQMDDDWFLKKTHDIQTFIGNLNKVKVAATTGIDPVKEKDPTAFIKKRIKEEQINESEQQFLSLSGQ